MVNILGHEIDGYLEVKNDGKWRFMFHIPDDRAYDTFAILGGIRNYCNAIPITECRGIPENTSKWDDFCIYSMDWHICNFGESWIDYSDIETYEWEQETKDTRHSNKLKKAKDYLTDKMSNLLFINMKQLANEYGNKNVRIIFWFY